MRYLYTAVTAERDQLRSPGLLPSGWRAVCFTDAPEVEHPGWQIRPLERRHDDPVRDARMAKILAHRFLPDADVSVWMDGNFTSACDLEALAQKHLSGRDLAFHVHPERDCVYEEAIACIKLHKDDADPIIRQIIRYAHAGYPSGAGLPATGVVLRRHTRAVARFESCWWQELLTGSRRDQLAIGWALRRTGLAWSRFDSSLREGPLFSWRRHDGPGAG